MLHTHGYLRTREAAVLLGVSAKTARAWGDTGRIPVF